MKNRSEIRRAITGLSGEAYWNEPLKKHTSLRIGGPADLLFIPSHTASLQELVARCHRLKIPLCVIGGTNLLVRDGGIRGIVVKLSRLDLIRQSGPYEIKVQAGVPMPRVARFAASRGLTGFEFALGIPGTIGGAVVMNAGTPDGEISARLKTVRLIRMDGTAQDLTRKDLSFGYRQSRIPPGIVVETELKLRKGQVDQIKRHTHRILEYRKRTQPLQWPSAGSIFKNPNGQYAAKIIEGVGLKGLRIGDAVLSKQHANFIINQGEATARDVARLIRIVGKKVEDVMGITLELELRIIGTY